MIPRRRNNEEGEAVAAAALSGDSNSNRRPSTASASASASSATTTSLSNSNFNDSNSNASSSSSTPRRPVSPRNLRRWLWMGLLMGGIAWITRTEQRVLDETNYEEARKEFQKNTNRHDQSYSTLQTFKRNPNAPSGKFVLGSVNEFTPGIAWLMSFPNSGTSFTMTMVARSTNRSFATNYGREVIHEDDTSSVSIYPRRPEGPYWPGLSGKQHTARELPETYVITKTHCGSRCSKCGPESYIESTETFLQRCASGHGEMMPGKERRSYDVVYSTDWVQRAIHLIRNPMHNIIARYHLEHRHKGVGYKNDTDWQAKHENDAAGLHKWCKAARVAYHQQDVRWFGAQEPPQRIPDAPCHGEFYKWTQWHNLAHQSIALLREGGPEKGPRRDVPVLKIYYEDYNTAFEDTAGSILEFLELERVAPFREFKSRSDYGGYFPMDELIEIKKLVKSVAIGATWRDVEHYFDGVPDDHVRE